MLSGASGSGKTRFLRAIADLDPSRGSVLLDGIERETIRPSAWRRSVAYLATDSRWWRDTPGEHFMPAQHAGPADLGLSTSIMDQPLARLSSGERQRLALLRLLSREPGVLLLDEPTANLDPESVGMVEALLIAYRSRRQATILWVSHDPGQRDRLGGRHLAMCAGKLDAVPT